MMRSLYSLNVQLLKQLQTLTSSVLTLDLRSSQLSEPTSAAMTTVEASLFVNYDMKRSNWIPVIGHPRDGPPNRLEISARRTNHDREFCYRYD